MESSQGATVTRQVFVHFNGTLTGGNAYALGAGEIDVTGTFRKNGGATITGGVADVPGNVDATSGFLFNAASLPALTTTNWVSEAILIPDVPNASQPGTFNHLLDVQGDLFFRYERQRRGEDHAARLLERQQRADRRRCRICRRRSTATSRSTWTRRDADAARVSRRRVGGQRFAAQRRSPRRARTSVTASSRGPVS